LGGRLPELLVLGRQFQRHRRASRASGRHHDRGVARALCEARRLPEASFKWVSSSETDFNRDYHVSFTPDEIAAKAAYYNFTTQDPRRPEREGISVFYKDPAGHVFRTYSTYARGIDLMNTTYNYLDLAPKGRDEGGRGPFWLRRHDEYESDR
jgi:predicted dithiol-disulfide oxidoreductase (DUF899 family)